MPSQTKWRNVGWKTFQISAVSDYSLRHWFPNTQQSRSPTACRRPEKLVLPSIFGTSLSSLMTKDLQSYPATVLNAVMWPFWVGVKTYSDPLLHILMGRRPQPQDIRSWNLAWWAVSNIAEKSRYSICVATEREGRKQPEVYLTSAFDMWRVYEIRSILRTAHVSKASIREQRCFAVAPVRIDVDELDWEKRTTLECFAKIVKTITEMTSGVIPLGVTHGDSPWWRHFRKQKCRRK